MRNNTVPGDLRGYSEILGVVSGHRNIIPFYERWSKSESRTEDEVTMYRRWIALTRLLVDKIDVETGISRGRVKVRLPLDKLAQSLPQPVGPVDVSVVVSDLLDISYDAQTLGGSPEFQSYTFS